MHRKYILLPRFRCCQSAPVRRPANLLQYVALQIYNVAVLRAVEVHHGWTVLGVIEEVQIVAALGQMDNVLALQGVVRHRAAHRLTDAQAICIVENGGGGDRLGHLLELPALFPDAAPDAVIRRVANVVVGKGGAVVGGHLVLPVGIIIGVGTRWITIFRAHIKAHLLHLP